MTVLLRSVIIGLAVIFLSAAVAKVVWHESFMDSLLMSGLPPRWLRRIGISVPVAEATAAAVLLSPFPLLGLAMSMALLLVFTAWMAWQLAAGRRLSCACFGAGNALGDS